MRQSIIGRYEKNDDDRLIIDVTAKKIEDLYARFDNAANYKKKDLDEDFAEYLTDCAREIKPHPFLIRINIEHQEPPDNFAKVKKSLHHYFKYLQERERHEINKHLGRSCYFLGLGIALVFLSLSLDARYDAINNIFIDLGMEGLTIVAWVSMWEAASNLIFEWVPHLQRFRQYGKIADSEIRFRKLGKP